MSWLLLAASALAQNEILPPATVTFEDIPAAYPASDLDLNDVALRYTARCDLVGAVVARQEVHLAAVAAGATKTNELWVALPVGTSSVTMAVDGGASTPLAPVGGKVQLFADFRDAFVSPPEGFVNTEVGADVVEGRPVVLMLEFTPGLTGPCPDVAFELHRSAEAVSPITLTSQVGPNNQPLAGAWPGDWAVPVERTPITTAYADFLDGVTGGCDPGDTACEHWFEHPTVGQTIPRADPEATAPILPLHTCADGLSWAGCECDGYGLLMTELTQAGATMVTPRDNDTGFVMLKDPATGQYRAWRGTGNGSGSSAGARIWSYTSADGLDWAAPTQTNIGTGAGSYTAIAPTYAWKDGSTYRLWYSQYYTASTSCSGWGWYWRSATSTDGVTWSGITTVDSNRAFAQLVDLGTGTYYGYMQISGDSNCNRRWRRRTSANLTSWGSDTPITLDGVPMTSNSNVSGHVGVVPTFFLTEDGTTVVMIAYTYPNSGARQIVRAESPVADGLAFTTTEVMVSHLPTCAGGGFGYLGAYAVPGSDEACVILAGPGDSVWTLNCPSFP